MKRVLVLSLLLLVGCGSGYEMTSIGESSSSGGSGGSGSSSTSLSTVKTFTQIIQQTPEYIVYNESINTSFVVDTYLNSVLKFDHTADNFELVSGLGKGTGTALANPKKLTVSPDGATVYLFDSNNKVIYSVDVATGNRTILSDFLTSAGTGPQFYQIDGITINASGSTLYVVDNNASSNYGVFAIDTTTGNRTLITDNTATATGSAIASGMSGIAVSSDESKLAIINKVSGELHTVDVATGNTTQITGAAVTFTTPQDLVMDSSGSTVYVIDEANDAISIVVLSNGSGAVISNNAGTGTGDNFGIVRSISSDSSMNNLYVADRSNDSIIQIDTGTGNRTTITSTSVGTGSALSGSVGLGLDIKSDDSALVTTLTNKVMEIDIATGNRTDYTTTLSQNTATSFYSSAEDKAFIIEQDSSYRGLFTADLPGGSVTRVSHSGSVSPVGSGTTFTSIEKFVIDSTETYAYVVDRTLQAVVRVNLATAARDILSDSGTGSGTNFSSPSGIAIDSTNTYLYVSDWGSDIIFRVEIATGNRTSISDNGGTGTGTNMDTLVSIKMGSTGTHIYGVDQGINALFKIELSTGNRTVISDSTTGSGMLFANLQDLTLNSSEEVAFVSDMSYDTIFGIDLSNGDRYIVSK